MATQAAAATAEASSSVPSTADRILDAALAVLARDGVAGVSMRAVASEAGVAVGLANYHFESKTAMICAALERIGDRDIDLVTPRDIDATPAEQLRECLHRAFDPSFLDASYLSLRLQLWSLAGVDSVYAEINQGAQRRYLDGLAALIDAARPDLSQPGAARRAADVLIEQNGVWLTAILVPDQAAIDRALARCEALAFDPL